MCCSLSGQQFFVFPSRTYSQSNLGINDPVLLKLSKRFYSGNIFYLRYVWSHEYSMVSLIENKKFFIGFIFVKFYELYCLWTPLLTSRHILNFFNRDLNRGCLVYMFSLRFSGSKILINLRRQFVYVKFFCERKISCTQIFAGFAVFSFCISSVRNLYSAVALSLKIAH